MSELHHHCQCDNCTGTDCGQDDPEKYKKEQERIQQEHDVQVAHAATLAVLTEIENGISAYEKEHENYRVADSSGMYIPINVVRRLITVRKPHIQEAPE
jgi:hypothetical protein